MAYTKKTTVSGGGGKKQTTKTTNVAPKKGPKSGGSSVKGQSPKYGKKMNLGKSSKDKDFDSLIDDRMMSKPKSNRPTGYRTTTIKSLSKNKRRGS